MFSRFGLATATVLLVVSGAPDASAQPSSGMAQDGRDELLKTFAVEALKATMPGAKLTFDISDFALDPLVAASTTRGTLRDKVDAWLMAMNQAGVSAAFPAYAIALSGGKIIIGGSIYTVEQLIEAGRDQQLQAILTGAGTGGWFDRFNNVMADTPFMQNAYVRGKGLTVDNLGDRIGSEAELRAIWYTNYGIELRDLYGRANAQEALDGGWPKLLALWQAQFAQNKLRDIMAQLNRAVAEAARRVDAKIAENEANGGAAPAAQFGAWDGTPPPGDATVDFNGTYSNGTTSTIVITGGNGNWTATEEWATGGRAGTNHWTNCKAIQATLFCDWTGDYRNDPDKSGQRHGTLAVGLTEVGLQGSYLERAPNFQWNVAPYESAMHDGAIWPINYPRVR